MTPPGLPYFITRYTSRYQFSFNCKRCRIFFGEKWKRWWVEGTKIMMFERKLFFLFRRRENRKAELLKEFRSLPISSRFNFVEAHFVRTTLHYSDFLLRKDVISFASFSCSSLAHGSPPGSTLYYFFHHHFLLYIVCCNHLWEENRWNESPKEWWRGDDRKQLRQKAPRRVRWAQLPLPFLAFPQLCGKHIWFRSQAKFLWFYLVFCLR